MKLTRFVVVLLLLISVVGRTQETISMEIRWQPSIPIGEEFTLTFEGASFGDAFVPVFEKKIALKNTNVRAEIKQMLFEPLTDEETKIAKRYDVKNKIEFDSQVYFDGSTPFLSIHLIPIKYNSSLNRYEKLVSFKVSLTKVSAPSRRNSSHTANNSAMREGEWLKVGVTKTGVYKVSYQQLLNAGITTPQNVRVYGYGGAVLPEKNNIVTPDDMQELPIEIQTGDDNVFNRGDYILFYAEGPNVWKYNSDNKMFYHYKHHYSDTIFYFISSGTGTGQSKEVALKQEFPSYNHQVNCFMDKQFYENDRVNLLHSGKKWYGEEYSALKPSHNFSFKFPNIIKDSLARIQVYAAARFNEKVSSSSHIKAFYGNSLIQKVEIRSLDFGSYTWYYVKEGTEFDDFTPKGDNINIRTTYNQYESYTAWLDFIRVNAVRELKMNASQLNFSNIYHLGGVNRFNLQGATNQLKVWNVTDLPNVQEMHTEMQSGTLSFNDDAQSIQTYCVFDPSKAYSVASIQRVSNQNLHGLENVEYVILTPKMFEYQANQIADYHRRESGLNTVVVTNQQVYNEFSSGTPDVTAIKSFMRHLYHQKSITDTLKYLLLFGDGSYDNKTQSSTNTNKILTYQSNGSISVSATYTCDDYFGLLDDSEGGVIGYLDIGIGRMVINTVEQADNAVRKVLNYNTSRASFGDWRSKITFVADNGDSNTHVEDADEMATFVENHYPEFNINKIYMDAYPLVQSAGGNIVPEATRDFNNAVESGTLLLNYVGHGGELGLAHEQLIANHDILSWSNSDKLATFLTATCEFTRYDDKNRTSAGEYVFLNEKGGGIALFTTTRIAFAGPNRVLNQSFYNHLYSDNEFRFGDLVRRTKNGVSSQSKNMRIFTLIGDPALSMSVPKERTATVKINNITVNDIDTINITPLSKVTVEGKLIDRQNQLLNDFNGIIYPTVYDKPDTVSTLCQFKCAHPFPFMVRRNIIYKGKVSVKNGKFSYSFIVPKDISYKNGLGRISYYATDYQTDAFGYTGNLSVSGSASGGITDTKGPVIELFMNDENFIYGGTTDESPMLIAKLFDENGINTVGNGIGHDVTAIIDNNAQKTVALNTYYEADLDSYQSGKIKYPYSKLSVGKHTLKLKAWDVLNNSSEEQLEFVVAESNSLAIKNIFNFPNPFTTNTDFYFDHNQPRKNLEVSIQIFTVSGKLVKNIETSFVTDGFRSEPIHWTGTDDYDDAIGRGVYIYKLQVRTETGEIATEFQKLVILK